MSTPQPPLLQVLFKRYAFGISHFVKNSEGFRVFACFGWLFLNLTGLILWFLAPNAIHSLAMEWHTWFRHNPTLHPFLIAMSIINILVFSLGWTDLIYRMWTSLSLSTDALNDTLNFVSPSDLLDPSVSTPSSLPVFNTNTRIKLLKLLMFIGILGTLVFVVLSMLLFLFTAILVVLGKVVLKIPKALKVGLKKCLTLRQRIQEKNQKFLDEHPEEAAKMLAKQLKETLPESSRLPTKSRL